MNMKKTIAGVMASIVVVSAMATTMVSAKEISYAAIDKVIDVAEDGYLPKEDASPDSYSSGTSYAATTAVVAGDSLDFNFSNKVNDVVVTLTGTGTYTFTKGHGLTPTVQQTYTNASATYDGDYGSSIWTLTGVAIPVGTYQVKVEYDVNPTTPYDNNKDLEKFDDKDDAEDANADTTVTLLPTSTAAVGTIYGAFAAAVPTAVTLDSSVSFDVDSSDSYITLDQGDVLSDNALVEDFDLDDEISDIAKALEARTKAKIIFNFVDPDDYDAEDGITVTAKFIGSDFSSIKATVDMDTKAMTATFDWGAITKAATSGTGLGDVSYRIDDIQLAFDADDASAGEDLDLESIEVKGDAETYVELSAGEAAKDSAAAITTAATAAATTAPVVAATTTAAAKNPTTGNAPIALAVIPVAIAAAAIIAKKRG